MNERKEIHIRIKLEKKNFIRFAFNYLLIVLLLFLTSIRKLIKAIDEYEGEDPLQPWIE